MEINQCLYLNDKLIYISSGIITFGCISLTFIFFGKLIKLRNWNPIQELSPILTIFQLISLSLFCITICMIFILNNIDAETHNIKLIIISLMILLNYTRGLFIVTNIIKSLRITLAFTIKIKRDGLIQKIFQSQIILAILIHLLVIFFWAGLYAFIDIYENIYIDSPNYQQMEKSELITSYEYINPITAFNNLIEVLMSLFIIYYNYKLNTLQYEILKKYITYPLIIYCLWLYFNTFANYLISKECKPKSDDQLPIGMIIQLISQLFRSFVEFYYVIIKPIKEAQFFRNPFFPSKILEEFELFIRVPLCNQAFYNYLLHKKQYSTKTQFQINNSQSREYMNCIDIFELWIQLTMIAESGDYQDFLSQASSHKYQNSLIIFDDYYSIQTKRQELLQYLQDIYQDYQQTNSFYKIQRQFYKFDKANENFYKLKLIDNFIY